MYQRGLFFIDTQLADSPIRDHPRTPIQNSNLVQVLAGKCPDDADFTLEVLEETAKRNLLLRDARARFRTNQPASQLADRFPS